MNPPDLIGMRRDYSKEIDSPSLQSNQMIVVKSIPMEFTQSLKTAIGLEGYQYKELTVSIIFAIDSTRMTVFTLHSLINT
jgi:hypothetical protein